MTSSPAFFATQTIDAPWPERGGGNRGANAHYPLIAKKHDILRIVLESGCWRPAENAHLYLWVTNNYLPWGLWLMDALGFDYKTNFPWVKTGSMGLGQYGRGCHELLLFGVRGRGYAVKTPATVRTDFLVGAPRPVYPPGHPKQGRVIHSAKPEKFYELVEKRSVGPYLQMFARAERANPDWYVWGNEV